MIKYTIEIKYRITCILIVLSSSTLSITIYKNYIVYLLLWNNTILPNSLEYFILTSITELFNVYFIIGCSIIKYLTIHYVYYHGVSFLSLGLYKKEYKQLRSFFLVSVLLWIFSTYIFFEIVLPLTCEFFFSLQNKSIKILNVYLEPKMDQYLKFVIKTYTHNYLCFQTLLMLSTILEYKQIKITLITNCRKLIYISVLIIATIITPPDIFSQICIFIFLIMCIEMHVLKKILNKKIFHSILS